jgi:putative ABC transport system permease protein
MVPQPGVRAAVIETKVKELLAKRHHIAPDDKRALGSANVEENFRPRTRTVHGHPRL